MPSMPATHAIYRAPSQACLPSPGRVHCNLPLPAAAVLQPSGPWLLAALDEALEDRGAFIEGGASGDVISFGFQCLEEVVILAFRCLDVVLA